MKWTVFLMFLVYVFSSDGESEGRLSSPSLTSPGRRCEKSFSSGNHRNTKRPGQNPSHRGESFSAPGGRRANAKLDFLYRYTGDTRAYRHIAQDPHRAGRFRQIPLTQLQNNLQWLEQFISFTGGRKERGHKILSYYLHHGWINPHILFASKKDLHKISTFLHQQMEKSPSPSKVREKIIGRLLIGEDPLTEESIPLH